MLRKFSITNFAFLVVLCTVVAMRADFQVGPLFPPHADYDYAPSMIRDGKFLQVLVVRK